MIIRSLAVFLTVCASVVLGLSAAAQMTDDAVVSYVKEGMAAGKSQQEMISELARRGVTREQAERLKVRFEQEQGQAEAVQAAGVQERTRRTVDAQEEMFPETSLMGSVLARHRLGISNEWIFLRIQKMVESGRLSVAAEAPEDMTACSCLSATPVWE